MASSNDQRLTAVKAALVATTNTSGYHHMKQIAANIVEDHLQKGLAQLYEDKDKATLLLGKARAMQDGFRDFFNTIEQMKQYDAQGEPDWFANLSFDATDETQVVDN